jgi:drug/metabolite transporter (DMT)-like permease
MTKALHMTLLVVMGVTWGLQFSMLKLAALADISEIEILSVSMLALALFFGAVTWARRGFFRLDRGRVVFLVITGALGYVAPLAAALVAAPHVSAGIITFIVSMTPIVTVVAALAARVERVSGLRLAAIGLGMAAAAFVIVPELTLPERGMVPWLAVVALVPLCYGIETAYVAARWPGGLDVMQVVTGETIVAGLMMAPLFVLYGEPARLLNLWSQGGIGVALFVTAGIVEVVLYFYLVQKAGAVFTSFGTFISLFAGIGWGMAIFAEAHGLMVWIAVAFLVAALALVLVDGRRPQIAV